MHSRFVLVLVFKMLLHPQPFSAVGYIENLDRYLGFWASTFSRWLYFSQQPDVRCPISKLWEDCFCFSEVGALK